MSSFNSAGEAMKLRPEERVITWLPSPLRLAISFNPLNEIILAFVSTPPFLFLIVFFFNLFLFFVFFNLKFFLLLLFLSPLIGYATASCVGADTSFASTNGQSESDFLLTTPVVQKEPTKGSLHS